MKTLAFELVSPEERLVSEDVALAVIPGVEGELGVGAGHTSLVVALKPGVVRLHPGGLQDTPRSIFIAGGFADVTGTSCTVLAEEAVNMSSLSREAVEGEIKTITHDLQLAVEDHDKKRLQSKLELANLKMAALSRSMAA